MHVFSRNFWGAMGGGLVSGARWYWGAINVVLTLFTVSTVIYIVTPSEDPPSQVAGVLAVVSLVALVALLFVQAPYAGQLEKTELAERERDDANGRAVQAEQALEPYNGWEAQQRREPPLFLHANLLRVNLKRVGPDPGESSSVMLRVHVVTQLLHEIRTRRVTGKLVVGGLMPAEEIEFDLSNPGRVIPALGTVDFTKQHTLSPPTLKQAAVVRDRGPSLCELSITIETQAGEFIDLPTIKDSA